MKSIPSRQAAYLLDIFRPVQAIQSYVAGQTHQQFLDDAKTQDAVKFLPNGDPAQLRQINEKWMLLQFDLCRLSTNCVQLIQPEATHGIAREQPTFVANAIRSALDMVAKVDHGSRSIEAMTKTASYS